MSVTPVEMSGPDVLQDLPLPLLKSLQLVNVLSFGGELPPIELGPLNILVGPNGAGKSNFIDTIDLLRACPISSNGRGDNGLQAVVRRGGGADEWIWKGHTAGNAVLGVVARYPSLPEPLHHVLEFSSQQQRFRLLNEYVENLNPFTNLLAPAFYYAFQGGNPEIVVFGDRHPRSLEVGSGGDLPEILKMRYVEADTSILAQRNDPVQFPVITYLAKQYDQIAIYREWTFGRSNAIREPQRADGRVDRLEEDFSNLGLFLNRLSGVPKVKRELVTRLRDIYDGVDDFHINIFANTVQIFFNEGDFQIPSTRLSDGTLRYLCLLAILLDPTPPPLICIEEPELGLHPDILPKIADLLIAASARTQLIVTTHSDIIVDSMTNHPEAVLIVEKVNGATTIKHLAEGAPRQRLGTMWMSGELGGTRW